MSLNCATLCVMYPVVTWHNINLIMHPCSFMEHIHSIILDITIVPLQVYDYSETLPTAALILCFSYHDKALQAALSKVLAQGPYLVARVGFEPATISMPHKAQNLPLSHHAQHETFCTDNIYFVLFLIGAGFLWPSARTNHQCYLLQKGKSWHVAYLFTWHYGSQFCYRYHTTVHHTAISFWYSIGHKKFHWFPDISEVHLNVTNSCCS